MFPDEKKPSPAARVGMIAAVLAGTAVLLWLVLRVLAAIHSGAGIE